MKTSASSIQLDLFDSINTRKPILCPALEIWQNEYSEMMRNNMEHRRLCQKWNVAGKNNAGVYVTDNHDVTIKKGGCTLTLSMTLRGDDVIAEVDIESNHDSYFGSYSPLSDISPLIAFDVYDHIEKVCDIISESISKKIERNWNLSSSSKQIFISMIPEMLGRVEMELTA